MSDSVQKPRVFTLCGSTRFPQAFDLANMHLTMQGHIVISCGLYGHADQPTGAKFLTSDGNNTAPAKLKLDELHKRKIDLADAIYVVNVGGYIGSSTLSEIKYAAASGKKIQFMFPLSDDEWHVVNNAIDHAISPLEKLTAANKQIATIREIEASHESAKAA